MIFGGLVDVCHRTISSIDMTRARSLGGWGLGFIGFGLPEGCCVRVAHKGDVFQRRSCGIL